MPRPPLAKIRHKRLGHRHRAKYIDVELATHLCQRRLLENPLVAITSVVYQYIHRAVPVLNSGDHRVDGIEMGNVQHHAMGPFRRERLEGCQ
ncbi:hypothetical protein D3C86_1491410 [compost metagenome]